MRCDMCSGKECEKGNPCVTKDSIPLYSDPQEYKMMQAAASVEADFYGDFNRIQEIVVFAGRMGYKKLGIAFCIGLASEAEKLCAFLSEYFEVESVCFKTCGIPKSELGAKRGCNVGETSCNPIEQARILKECGTELNLLLGLCVGHDALFIKHSHTYVIPVAVKDRVTGHNPLAAIYCSAAFKKMNRIKLDDKY